LILIKITKTDSTVPQTFGLKLQRIRFIKKVNVVVDVAVAFSVGIVAGVARVVAVGVMVGVAGKSTKIKLAPKAVQK
jgi:hypothetical protein